MTMAKSGMFAKSSSKSSGRSSGRSSSDNSQKRSSKRFSSPKSSQRSSSRRRSSYDDNDVLSYDSFDEDEPGIIDEMTKHMTEQITNLTSLTGQVTSSIDVFLENCRLKDTGEQPKRISQKSKDGSLQKSVSWNDEESGQLESVVGEFSLMGGVDSRNDDTTQNRDIRGKRDPNSPSRNHGTKINYPSNVNASSKAYTSSIRNPKPQRNVDLKSTQQGCNQNRMNGAMDRPTAANPAMYTPPNVQPTSYPMQQGYNEEKMNVEKFPATTMTNQSMYNPSNNHRTNHLGVPLAQAVPVATDPVLQHQHSLEWKIQQSKLKIQQHEQMQLQLQHEQQVHQLQTNNTTCRPWISFRVIAFLGGISLIASAIISDIFNRQAGNMRGIMEIFVSLYLFLFGILTCLLESGDASSSSSSTFSSYCCSCKCYTHMRMALLNNAMFLRQPSGRSLFYMFAGTLAIAQMTIPSCIAGGYMALVGIVYGITGCRYHHRLENALCAIVDEEMIIGLYKSHENHQGMLDEKGFTRILQMVDPTISKIDIYAAFLEARLDRDGHVSFEDWREWVMSGRKRYGLVNRNQGSKDIGMCYEI